MNDFFLADGLLDPPRWPIAADFNGNGKLDLAALATLPTNPTLSSVAVQLGNGDGSFQAPVLYAVGASAYSIAVGDSRGNGKLDIVATNYDENTISVLLGNGDGTFQPPTTYPTANGPEYLAVGDFNGDGKLDIVSELSFDDSCALFPDGPLDPTAGNHS